MSTIEAHYYGRKQNNSTIEATYISNKLHQSVKFPLLSPLDIRKFKLKISHWFSIIEFSFIYNFFEVSNLKLLDNVTHMADRAKNNCYQCLKFGAKYDSSEHNNNFIIRQFY